MAPAKPAPTSTSDKGHGAQICKWNMCVYIYMAVCQNLVPLVNIKIAGKWMFIPLKMVCVGIDPYPYIYVRIIYLSICMYIIFISVFMFTYMYIYTDTDTHTYIYIYIILCIIHYYLCVCVIFTMCTYVNYKIYVIGSYCSIRYVYSMLCRSNCIYICVSSCSVCICTMHFF